MTSKIAANEATLIATCRSWRAELATIHRAGEADPTNFCQDPEDYARHQSRLDCIIKTRATTLREVHAKTQVLKALSYNKEELVLSICHDVEKLHAASNIHP